MSEDLVTHIDRLIQQRPASETSLAPFRELVLLMARARPEVKEVHVEERIKDIQKKEGFPLFSRDALPLDLDSAAELLEAFLAHLADAGREDAAGLSAALEKTRLIDNWPERLFRAILSQDGEALSLLASEVKLEPNVLLFLGKTALRPSIERLRAAFTGDMDKQQWSKGYCPLCGSQPDMAFFEKTGKRHLHCELCGEEWPFPRIKCPFCNTEDQEKLGYFEAEEEEGFRVYFCRVCNRYIKTIDKKAFEEVAPLELENLATLHLDLLARENGFT